MADRRLHVHGRRAEADLAAVVAAEGGGELAVGHGDSREALEKVDVDEGAAELAIGAALQAGVLLALHHRVNAVVLGMPERGVLEPSRHLNSERHCMGSQCGRKCTNTWTPGP